MKVLVACEFSGAVRDAFASLGHDAWSCDLIPTESGTRHFVWDCLDIARSSSWDLMVAHPPCTYLCSSGLRWNSRRPGRSSLTEQSLEFVQALMDMRHIPKIAIENPIGCISTRIRNPDQIIQPYQFGSDAKKSTCLWLKGLPLLRETQYIEPRIVDGKERWSNQTDSGQNKLGPSEDRAAERARTYPGIAAAMASQWRGVIQEFYDVLETSPVFPGESPLPHIIVDGKLSATPCRLNLRSGDRIAVQRNPLNSIL